MWELLAGTVLGLGSAMIVSKSDSLRRRRDAASLVRLKLEAWADDVERTIEFFRDQRESQSDNEILLLVGSSMQRRRPQIGSLFESRLAELMGYEARLDEQLMGFHDAATDADQRFARIGQQHGLGAFADEAAHSDLRWAAQELEEAAGFAIRSAILLEDLFGAGWTPRWNRLRAAVGIYQGLPPRKRLQVAERVTDLMMMPGPEGKGEDEDT